MSTYLNCTRASYEEALRGLYIYADDVIHSEGFEPEWLKNEINRITSIIINWDALTNGTNEQTGQGDSEERQ